MGKIKSSKTRRKPRKITRGGKILVFCEEGTRVGGITPKQAKVILREKVRQLIQMLKLLRDSQINAMKKMLISRDVAIFSLAFCTSKRGDDISKLVAKNVMRMPNKGVGF